MFKKYLIRIAGALCILAVKAPGILKDAENLMSSDCDDTFFYAASEYLLREGTQTQDLSYSYELANEVKDQMMETADDGLYMIADMNLDMPGFEQMTLRITYTPFIAVVLAIVPIVLDVYFKSKKEKKIQEEPTYGR